MTEPYYREASVDLYLGDALDVMDDLKSVDAIVTDPPYASGTRHEAGKSSSGAMLRAGRFAKRPLDLDQMTTTGFVWMMRAIAMSGRSLLPDGGSLLSFIDWRQWPNLVGAIETANLRVQGMIVWDKGHFGLGNGFRSQHELVLHASRGVPVIHERATGNVLTHKRVKPTEHPSPKPVEMMTRLIRVVTPLGGVVLDPFAGSGTTLVAARDAGYRAIGVEMDEAYCEVAATRLSAA